MSKGNNNKDSEQLQEVKSAGRPKGSTDSYPRERTSSKTVSKTKKYTQFTTTKRNRFLRLLEKTGNINSSAAEVGVSRPTIYALMNRNPSFKEKVQMARDKATGALEQEAYRRAVEGVEEAKYFKGKVVGTELKYSDGLLQRLLEANDPERYGKKSYNYSEQNISVNGGESAKSKLAALLKLNPEDVLEGDFEEVDEDNE